MGRTAGVVIATSKLDLESIPNELESYVHIAQSVYGLVVGMFLTPAIEIENSLPAF